MASTRTVAVNGIELFLREQGEGPLVILCHGWPELSYSWRHQIGALADAGFRVVAPDMRGFGRSSAPQPVEAYSIFDLVGDMVGLVAALKETKAAIIGHDWGAPVAWHAAQFRPDLFSVVAGLSVPPPWRGKGRPLDALRAAGITNFYWQYFQKPGVAEAELERDVAATMRGILCGGFADPARSLFIPEGRGFLGKSAGSLALPDWLSEAELTFFTEQYRESGFRGGLNWYRNIDRNWELTAPWQDARIHQPALFIAGAKDPVISDKMSGKHLAAIERVLPNLKQKLIIDNAGHWIQQEKPAEVNAALIAFLKENY
jgi:pimeloyl-ACP methyl ester carboxylesterase